MIKTTYIKLMREQKALKELESQLTDQKKLVESLRDEMIAEMNTAGTDSYKSDLGSIALMRTDVPTVDDWDAFYKFVHSHNAFDLLQRRVSSSAWRDRVEEGENIPGVKKFQKETLRIALKG